MKQNQKSSNNGFAENWLPVKGISNGGIQLENGYVVTGIKVVPKNIFILDYDSQNNLIFNLRTFYDRIPFEFWLIVIDRPVDINQYVARLQLQFNEIQDLGIRKLLSEDIQKAEMFMNREVNVVDIEYYILFKEKKPDVIAKRTQELISNLASCGISSRQTTNEDMRGFLDSFFNANVQTNYGAVIVDEQ